MNNNSTNSNMPKKCPYCESVLFKDKHHGTYKCNKCGYVETLLPNVSSNVISPSSPKQYGWICPKCGSVMAPYESSCIFCRPTNEFVWTASTKSESTQHDFNVDVRMVDV